MFLGILVFGGFFAFSMYYMYSMITYEINKSKKKSNNDSIEELGALTINVKKLGPQNREYFSLEEDRDVTSYSHGPTLHVGSVSVGNVTSGGAYVTPGYTTYSTGEKNGFYNIKYCKSPVCEIQFHNSKLQYKLHDELKKSEFSSHVKDGYRCDYIDCYHLTKKECEEIINFICDEKNQYN